MLFDHNYHENSVNNSIRQITMDVVILYDNSDMSSFFIK